MRICVTGAGGYLGRGIVSAILNYGAEVVAFGPGVDRVDARALRLDGDIFSLEDPYEDLYQPDVVVHLAWEDGFNHNAASHINKLPLHCAFIDKVCASPVSELCVMGSMHEVGYHEGPVNADTPCFPMSRYGIAKNALRDYCELAARETGTKLKWLRGFYIVDSDITGSSVFSKIAQAAKNGRTQFPFTSGKNMYDFLDYSDFCRRVAAVIVQREEFGIINVCSGKPVSLGERVSRFIQDEGFDIELVYGAFPDRPYDSPGIWGDSTIIDRVMASDTINHQI